MDLVLGFSNCLSCLLGIAHVLAGQNPHLKMRTSTEVLTLSHPVPAGIISCLGWFQLFERKLLGSVCLTVGRVSII